VKNLLIAVAAMCTTVAASKITTLTASVSTWTVRRAGESFT